MDGLEFTASIVRSVAWPATICVVSWVFRKPLEGLLRRMKDFELWGSKVSFGDKLRDAEKVAYRLESVDGQLESTTSLDDPYLELATRFPEAAVIESYRAVEQFVGGLSTAPTKRRNAPRDVVQTLFNEKRISSDVYQLFIQINETRNVAVHSNNQKISSAEAIAYRDLCKLLIAELQTATQDLTNEARGD